MGLADERTRTFMELFSTLWHSFSAWATGFGGPLFLIGIVPLTPLVFYAIISFKSGRKSTITQCRNWMSRICACVWVFY